MLLERSKCKTVSLYKPNEDYNPVELRRIIYLDRTDRKVRERNGVYYTTRNLKLYSVDTQCGVGLAGLLLSKYLFTIMRRINASCQQDGWGGWSCVLFEDCWHIVLDNKFKLMILLLSIVVRAVDRAGRPTHFKSLLRNFMKYKYFMVVWGRPLFKLLQKLVLKIIRKIKNVWNQKIKHTFK